MGHKRIGQGGHGLIHRFGGDPDQHRPHDAQISDMADGVVDANDRL
jgi:hypothetical protein